MRTVSQSELAASLPSLLEEVEREPIVIEKDGRDFAMLVSLEETDAVRAAKVARFMATFDRVSKAIQERAAADNVDLDELMRALDRKAE